MSRQHRSDPIISDQAEAPCVELRALISVKTRARNRLKPINGRGLKFSAVLPVNRRQLNDAITPYGLIQSLDGQHVGN